MKTRKLSHSDIVDKSHQPAMQAQASATQLTIDEIVTQIFAVRQIDRGIQRQLMNALLTKATLNAQDKAHIRRVFDALQRGLLRVV